MDSAGNEKKDQIPEGTESNPKEEQPKSSSGEDKKDQISEKTESNPKEEQPNSSSGKDKKDQISEGTESNPKEEQPNSGKDQKDQIPEGTKSNPEEEQSKSDSGKDKKDQIPSEGAMSNKKEQPKSSSGTEKNDQISKGTEPNTKEEQAQSCPERKATTYKASEDDAEKILEELGKGKKPAVVVLTGDAGTGKTWLAREIIKKAVRPLDMSLDAGTGKTSSEITKKAVSSFEMSLWISLKEDQHNDYQSIHQSIALQLSIPTIAGVWEDVDDSDDWEKEYAKDLDDSKMKKRIVEKLDEKLRELQEKTSKKNNEKNHTFLLLVLDSEGELEEKDYDHIKEVLRLSKELRDSYSILVTTRSIEKCPNFKDTVEILEIQPLSGKEALILLDKRIEDEQTKKREEKKIEDEQTKKREEDKKDEQTKKREEDKKIKKRQKDKKIEDEQTKKREEDKKIEDEQTKKRVGVEDDIWTHEKWQTFRGKIELRSKVLPAQIIMLAEALIHIANDGLEALERALDAALNILQQADKDDPKGPKPLLHFTYEKLPNDCMINCFWHSWNFLRKHGGVQYNELIAHWMLEGYLDLAAGVKEAYDKGIDVLTKLVDRGMLKMQEHNLIVLEGATNTLDDDSCRGLFETSNLGLACMLEDGNRKVFERMAPADGMMKTVSLDRKGKPVCSLLIDGSRLCRAIPETFFEAKKDLKVLALFYPRLTSLPKSISEMKHLLVLVLRGCYLLNDIDGIQTLEELRVLEISDAPFLKEMPDELFAKMLKLRSLNLYALGIKSVPLSLSELTDLRRLILRKCSFLESLPKLGKLTKLEVIDLSGSSSLIKIQEKCFQSFEELRFIDFSETKIEKLPIVQKLKKLTILLVKGCDRLYGLRHMKHLPSLKVLDVSGATMIKEIIFDCFFETEHLRILDLSKTEIRFLPDSLSKDLCELRLKDCPKLIKLTSTEALTNLKSLDLSGSSDLKEFPDKFFEHLKSLQSFNLSNTKVTSLPCLSNLVNLRRLMLKGCSLENLPELNKLTSLVELDVSNYNGSATKLPSLEGLKFLEIINLPGYKALSEIDPSFEHMSWLKVLNLSETQISKLPSPFFSEKKPPSPCNPSKLRSLILRNCTELQTSPNFEILSQLEHLDLRGTSSLKDDIKVESLNRLTQLRKLKLSRIAVEGSQSLLLEILNVLDLSGEAVKSLPWLDDLINLRKLVIRGCSILNELPSLKSLSHLEVLDLSGTSKVKNLIEIISELTHLKRLHLPEEVIEESKKSESVKFLPLEVKLDRCCISKPSDIPQGDKKPQVIVHGTEIFKSLKEDSKLLENIRTVHLQSKDEDNYGDSRRHIFRDIYSKIKNVPSEAKDVQSLEIIGFDDFPADIEVNLEQAKYVFLVENDFLKNLSDLKPCSFKNMEYFWLERCTKLESLYDEKVQSLCFWNVKHLYIDCCPMLETIFSSGQIPENLETLQIKFSVKLKSLVGDKGSASGAMLAMGSADKKGPTTSSANKKVQDTSSADKEEPEQAMSSADKEVQTMSKIKLKNLHISYCPMLETVFSSTQLPPSLEVLEIKSCDRLKSLSQLELANTKLPNLQRLHLLDLPNWTSSGIWLNLDEPNPNFKVSPNIREILRSGNASKGITGADEN